MDIMEMLKDKIEEIVEKIKADKNIAAKFQKDPISVVEELLGVDLPDDLVNQIIEGVKAKISLEKVGDALNALGGLFGKK
jgi:signal recognition particle GTPase